MLPAPRGEEPLVRSEARPVVILSPKFNVNDSTSEIKSKFPEYFSDGHFLPGLQQLWRENEGWCYEIGKHDLQITFRPE